MVTVAAVLAGGRSTRMGREKALIPINGVPLAIRAASLLKRCGIEEVFVVGRQTSLHRLGLPVISDPVTEGHHPLYGIAATLQQTTEPVVLFVPCDVVNLTEGHIHALLAEGGPCVARSEGVKHPLLAILPTSLAEQARSIADLGQSAHTLVRGLPVVDLPGPNLHDANSPEQLPR